MIVGSYLDAWLQTPIALVVFSRIPFLMQMGHPFIALGWVNLAQASH